MNVRPRVATPADDSGAVFLARVAALRSSWAELQLARQCFGVESAASAAASRSLRSVLLALSGFVNDFTEPSLRVHPAILLPPAVSTDEWGNHTDADGFTYDQVIVHEEATYVRRPPASWPD